MKNNDIRNSKETYYSHIIREHASHGEYTTFTGFIEDKIQKYRNHQDNPVKDTCKPQMRLLPLLL